MVGVVGQKGHSAATETILRNYLNTTEDNKRKNYVFYDNALWRIGDKRYIANYLSLLNSPNDAARFPLTMNMLGRWQVAEAKPLFIRYLTETQEYDAYTARQLVFVAMDALSRYKNDAGDVLRVLQNYQRSDDKDVAAAASKAVTRIRKRIANANEEQ